MNNPENSQTANRSYKKNGSLIADLWNTPLPKDNSAAMNVFIVLLKIIATVFLLFAWIFLLFIIAGFDAAAEQEHENSSSSTPDPYLDAFNGVDENGRFWLGKKENF